MHLETERLRIRPFVDADCMQAFGYLSDPAVMRFVEPPFTLAQAQAFVRDCGIRRRLVYAVVVKETQAVIGHAIFHPFDRPDAYEIGWIFSRDAWRKGYGIETGRALIEYAFAKRSARRVVAETSPDNEASIRLIQRLGLARQANTDGLLTFAMDRTAFCADP